METTSRSTGNNPKTSQGGLTSPKLYDSGLDFRIAVAKNTEGRQVRISCINVAHNFSHRVKCCINVCANQLPICHVAILSHSQNQRESSVANMFMRIVADMSLLQICQSSVVFMFMRIVAQISRCKYVTSRCIYVTLLKCHT